MFSGFRGEGALSIKGLIFCVESIDFLKESVSFDVACLVLSFESGDVGFQEFVFFLQILDHLFYNNKFYKQINPYYLIGYYKIKWNEAYKFRVIVSKVS